MPDHGRREHKMYLPSAVPVTRLAVSTSLVPSAPAPEASTRNAPVRLRSQFKGKLGGVQEEHGDEVLAMVPLPPPDAHADDEESDRWLMLTPDELSIWQTRPRVVLAKLRRTSASLRALGANALITVNSHDSIAVTTASAHTLFYKLKPWKDPKLGREQGKRAQEAVAYGDPVYTLPASSSSATNALAWPPGPAEGRAIQGVVIVPAGERSAGVGEGVACTCSVGQDATLVSLQDPPCIRIIPSPTAEAPVDGPRSSWERSAQKRSSGEARTQASAVMLDEWSSWLVDPDVTVNEIVHLRTPAATKGDTFASMHDFVMIASDGRAYLVRWDPERASRPYRAQTEVLFDDADQEKAPEWRGVCFHEPSQGSFGTCASSAAFNPRFGLAAIGCENGSLSVYTVYPRASAGARGGGGPPKAGVAAKAALEKPALAYETSLRKALKSTSSGLECGAAQSLAWTSDGYALAVGWRMGWALFSVFGRLSSWSVAGALASGGGYGIDGDCGDAFEDHYMRGVKQLFWGQANLELYLLCAPPENPKGRAYDEQLFIVHIAKSAVTSLHSPDNTKHAFLQLDDRVMVYRGADQPDMSVINPESDVWQHIKMPLTYTALQHPIRYAAISSDARFIAVAGRRGLTHYNALSGRWKLFESEVEEESVRIAGGMAWWSNVLIAGCVTGNEYQLRLFPRDRALAFAESREVVVLDSEPLMLAVFDCSLLVYTADNTFYHYLIHQIKSGHTKLRLCGSIGFEGVVADPRAVRGISWLIPRSQQRFGDPADDLNVATIIFLIRGNLVLLRPRRAAHEEVRYDLQVLADRVEFYWTHLSGVGTLENSLWGFDGEAICVWLGKLTIESATVAAQRGALRTVSESVSIPLSFYPLAVLMDKGIVVGVEPEVALRRSVDFAMHRITTSTHLFIQHILRYHLEHKQMHEAIVFASYYQHLVYFGHAIEMALHAILEDEADAQMVLSEDERDDPARSKIVVLPTAVDFLDHFDESLEVVVGCARKTEITRWPFLFDTVGKPRDLFEKCMQLGRLKTAASYLLVLHNLESIQQSSKDTVLLLEAAMEAEDWTLCRELLRFLYSLDRSGKVLKSALIETGSPEVHEWADKSPVLRKAVALYE